MVVKDDVASIIDNCGVNDQWKKKIRKNSKSRMNLRM